SYLDLTKSGIVIFVLLSGIVGYAFSYPIGQHLDFQQVILLLLGLYFLSSGSFVLNQAQEWKIDQKMPRTSLRPIPTGKISVWQAYSLSIIFIFAGLFLLYLLTPLTSLMGFATVVMYNGFYTLIWKRKWNFGAVPGAIPGALPVVIGYSVNSSQLLSTECIYLFLIMFLWQMPHFWCLAIKFKNDYQAGGIPVLPLAIGEDRTKFHMGLYTFVYIGVALIAPILTHSSWLFLLLIVPFAIKVLIEFFKYFENKATEKNWLPFFLWINLSMLVFLAAPVLDKWFYYHY
ncbi:MAG: protoheme IX farnesyltransferase, partial [Bdellovibrionaceae bacterium]|nr:protoheme IX farnesyltransferase [Pseudobdellovibrionaceae bacterium]